MSKAKRGKPIYQRGPYRLDRRPDRANLEITWYDPGRGRERSTSASTSDDEEGKKAVDRLYLAKDGGRSVCPTCGQARVGQGDLLVTSVIRDYLLLKESAPSFDAIEARLSHVLIYISQLPETAVFCSQIDEPWIKKFREWAVKQPIVSANGERKRSLSTVENSVLQLAAAINDAHNRQVLAKGARFKPIPTKRVNRTPQYRASVEMIAAAFRYCVNPKISENQSEKWRERLIKERSSLLNFLRISVTTLCRPDAAHEVSTEPSTRQWNSERQILSLNPDGRAQTKKYRAVVPIARQMAPILDACRGNLVPVNSVKKAHEAMAADIGLPGNGESGMKLWRRSMADLLRERLPVDAWGEIEMFLGHDKFDDVSDLYAPFRPDYLRRALGVIEDICEEIEILVPGAFYRDTTAQGGNVYSIGNAKNG